MGEIKDKGLFRTYLEDIVGKLSETALFHLGNEGRRDCRDGKITSRVPLTPIEIIGLNDGKVVKMVLPIYAEVVDPVYLEGGKVSYSVNYVKTLEYLSERLRFFEAMINYMKEDRLRFDKMMIYLSFMDGSKNMEAVVNIIDLDYRHNAISTLSLPQKDVTFNKIIEAEPILRRKLGDGRLNNGQTEALLNIAKKLGETALYLREQINYSEFVCGDKHQPSLSVIPTFSESIKGEKYKFLLSVVSSFVDTNSKGLWPFRGQNDECRALSKRVLGLYFTNLLDLFTNDPTFELKFPLLWYSPSSNDVNEYLYTFLDIGDYMKHQNASHLKYVNRILDVFEEQINKGRSENEKKRIKAYQQSANLSMSSYSTFMDWFSHLKRFDSIRGLETTPWQYKKFDWWVNNGPHSSFSPLSTSLLYLRWAVSLIPIIDVTNQNHVTGVEQMLKICFYHKGYDWNNSSILLQSPPFKQVIANIKNLDEIAFGLTNRLYSLVEKYHDTKQGYVATELYYLLFKTRKNGEHKYRLIGSMIDIFDEEEREFDEKEIELAKRIIDDLDEDACEKYFSKDTKDNLNKAFQAVKDGIGEPLELITILQGCRVSDITDAITTVKIGLEGYTIIQKIGSGGATKRVYLVNDSEGKPFVLKIAREVFGVTGESFIKEVAAKPDDILTREDKIVTILRKNEHENIVRVYKLGRLGDGRPYSLEEYVEGETLRYMQDRANTLFNIDIIRKEHGKGFINTSYCPRDFLSMPLYTIKQLLDGVAHLHSNRIIHGDLNPKNIMGTNISPTSPKIKIIDFGCSAIIGEKGYVESGEMLSTPRLFSPYEWYEEHIYTFASDVYQLGLLMYYLFDNQLPFATTKEQIANEIRKDEFYHTMRRNIEKAVFFPLVPIIQKCIEKDHTQRYENALELRDAVESIDPVMGEHLNKLSIVDIPVK